MTVDTPLVTSREIPFTWVVRKADPEFEKLRRLETEYEFSNGRVFTARQADRGVYQDEREVFDLPE